MSLATQTQETREEAVKKRAFPTVKITEITKLMDRMLLIGPPGIGKTEVLQRLSVEDAQSIAKERGLKFRTFEEVLKSDEEVDLSKTFVFVDVRELIKRARGGDEKAERLLSKLIDPNFQDHFYLYLRIIASHLRPEDIQIPLPQKITQIGVEFELPAALRLFTLPKVYGTLFIDELTNLPSPAHASFYFSLVQERELGLGNKLSDKVKIVAAGNPSVWSTAAVTASELPEPLVNRMVVFYIKPSTVQEWLEYMEKNEKLNSYVATYLLMNPNRLLASEEELAMIKEMGSERGVPMNFPTPRSWTMLSEILNTKEMAELIQKAKGMGNEASDALRMLESVVYGAIGPITGKDFINVLLTEPEDPRKVLEDPKRYLTEWNNRLDELEKEGKYEESSKYLTKVFVSLFHLGKHVAELLLVKAKSYGEVNEETAKKAVDEMAHIVKKLADEVIIPVMLDRAYKRLPPELAAALGMGTKAIYEKDAKHVSKALLKKIGSSVTLAASSRKGAVGDLRTTAWFSMKVLFGD